MSVNNNSPVNNPSLNHTQPSESKPKISGNDQKIALLSKEKLLSTSPLDPIESLLESHSFTLEEEFGGQEVLARIDQAITDSSEEEMLEFSFSFTEESIDFENPSVGDFERINEVNFEVSFSNDGEKLNIEGFIGIANFEEQTIVVEQSQVLSDEAKILVIKSDNETYQLIIDEKSYSKEDLLEILKYMKFNNVELQKAFREGRVKFIFVRNNWEGLIRKVQRYLSEREPVINITTKRKEKKKMHEENRSNLSALASKESKSAPNLKSQRRDSKNRPSFKKELALEDIKYQEEREIAEKAQEKLEKKKEKDRLDEKRELNKKENLKENIKFDLNKKGL